MGIVEILVTNADGIKQAQQIIKDICFIPEVGEIYDGIVKSIQPYGAFVEINKGTDGLLHISEITEETIQHPKEILSENQELELKIISLEPEKRRLGLSLKQINQENQEF